MTRAAAALCGFAFAALSGCGYHSTKIADEPAGADYAGRAVAGDIDRGKLVFATNCSTCHGTDGRSGGVGPSLIDEDTRQNLARTIVWIENPAYPMPKLYPSPLSESDVEDVAAYVQNIR